MEIAIAFATHGVAAILERLDDSSPWSRLDRQDALNEIAARLGPAEGATWELETAAVASNEVYFSVYFPSGQQEIVALRLGPAPEFRIQTLRSLIDPVATDSPEGATVARRAPGDGVRPLVVGALLLFGMLRFSTGDVRKAVTLLLALVGTSCGPNGSSREASESERGARLGNLAIVRRQFALGEPSTATRQQVLEAGSVAARVVELWEAERALLEGGFAAAQSVLDRAFEREPPLANLLRARLAAQGFRREEALYRYDAVRTAGFEGDGLAFETAALDAALSGGSPTPGIFDSLRVTGSRRAEPWYEAARLSALESSPERGELLLRQAWNHEPLPREELFADPFLAHLAARAPIFPLFAPGSSAEPVVPPSGAMGQPLIAEGIEASSSGNRLRLTAGAGNSLVIEIPGGASIAPVDTQRLDASAFSRSAEVRAITEVRRHLLGRAQLEIETSPRVTTSAKTAFAALRRDRRWAEIEELSRPLVANIARLSPEVVRSRAAALVHLDRESEAFNLLVGFAKQQLVAKRPEPGTLYQLADLLSRRGDYDSAIAMVRKADGQLRLPIGERRLRIYEMARELLRDSSLQQVDIFDVRSPRRGGTTYPSDLGRVLQLERRRMASIVPLAQPRRIEVELFPYQSFVSAFGGNVSVIGVFDGRLRVPLADIQTLHPQVVAVVSHELLHALLAQASREGAPSWFHEGLAQWFETGTTHANPYPELDRRGHVIAFSLLEPILRGFSEQSLVELAYSESLWAVVFLESRWGQQGLRDLVGLFAQGMGTAEAIGRLTGLSLEEFDRELRRWAVTAAPAYRNITAQRFDEHERTLFERQSKESKERSEPMVGVDPDRFRAAANARLTPEMKEWFATYRSSSEPVRSAYAPILKVYAAGTGEPDRADCRKLESAVYELRTDGRSLRSPDTHVESSLRAVYDAMARLSAACVEDRLDDARTSYRLVGQAMSEAGARLRPYGLKP